MATTDLTRAPDENVVDHSRFAFSLMQFFATTHVQLTSRRVLTSRPTLALGLLPVGSERASFPLRNVAAVGTSFTIGILTLPLGAILLLISLVGLAGGNFPGVYVVTTLIALALVSDGLRTRIWIENNAGRRAELPIVFWEKGHADALAERINAAIGALD